MRNVAWEATEKAVGSLSDRLDAANEELSARVLEISAEA